MVNANDDAMRKIRHGAPCNLPEFSGAHLVRVFQGQDQLAAICRRIAGTLFAVKVNLAAS